MMKLSNKCARFKQSLAALNKLAVALADHNHKWTKRERWLYQRASTWLASFCGADSAASS